MIKQSKCLLNQFLCLNHHCTLLIPSLFLAIPLFSMVAPILDVPNLPPPFLAMVGNRGMAENMIGGCKGAMMVKVEWITSVKI